MRKGRDGEKNVTKTGGKKEKRRMKIVATTSLPAVDRPNADRWNAARLRQYLLNILIIQERYFHFLSIVADKLCKECHTRRYN